MQVIGYKWKNNETWKPSLITNNNGIKFHDLFDSNISLRIGDKFCVGYFSNGSRKECPTKEKIIKGNMCESCREKDPYSKCIECNGICINKKNRDNCKDSTFYLYFTTFGSLLKVGISQEHRFFERMIEQGAELGIKFSRIKDGLEARILEQKIKKLLYCEDRVYGTTKERNIFGNPNEVILKIKDALRNLRENNYNMISTEIYDFRKYYRLNRVKKDPLNINIDKDTVIEGNVVAAKGNIIILKNQDNFYTVNIHRLISREVFDFEISKPLEIIGNENS